MIKLRIDEPSRGQPIKTIRFLDEQDYCFRIVYFLGEKIVLDELTEYTNSKQVANETLFNGQYEVLAYRNYLRDSKEKLLGAEDYRIVNGKPEKLNSILGEVVSEHSAELKRLKFFNPQNELAYYMESEEGFTKHFKPNGVEFDEEMFKSPIGGVVELFHITHEYLRNFVKENT